MGNWFIDARNAEESRIATLQREYDRMYQLVKAAIALHREWDAAADLNIEAFSDDATEIVDRFDAACKAYEET